MPQILNKKIDQIVRKWWLKVDEIHSIYFLKDDTYSTTGKNGINKSLESISCI